ncbi:MAG: hypothetical protein EP324_08210 [Gammaproteobacteria bacterium]|nr:MAG: hypothetical protein EP324_08210 [Gammaproteobacteria bacterium]
MSELYGNSASISTTEYSLPNNSTTLTPITTEKTVQVFLNTSAIAAGDEFELRIYDKVISGGSQVLVFPIVTLTSGIDAWVSPALRLKHGWDVTLVKTAGTDRTIEWSLRDTV